MEPEQTLSTNEEELTWPETPSGLVILGKRQGTKKENKQLWGRAAMAAALWHSAPQPKPYIIFVAADIHGPTRKPDAAVVKTLLLEQFEVPADYLIVRQQSYCTLLEVRATRVLRRVYGLGQLFALTHLYHAPRTQRYLNEVLPDAAVIPVHPEILDEIEFPPHYDDLLPQLEMFIKNSQPRILDRFREHLIEVLLGLAHTIDRRGRFERWLARRLRPTAY